jgi:hypothetical protein
MTGSGTLIPIWALLLFDPWLDLPAIGLRGLVGPGQGRWLERLHGEPGFSRPNTFGRRTPGEFVTASSMSATISAREAGWRESRSASFAATGVVIASSRF